MKNHFLTLFASLALLLSSVDANEHAITRLQLLQPNWQLKTLTRFSQGFPEFLIYMDNEIPVKQIELSESGKLLNELDVEQGPLLVPHGPYVHYLPDGEIEQIACYSHGILSGQILARTLHFENGLLHGEQVNFYPNGSKQARLSYKNGILYGPKILWDENGTILEEATYDNGNLEGQYILKKDGKKVIYPYKKHILDGPHQIFYPSYLGKENMKALEAHYHNGLLEGELAEYSENGIKIISTFYLAGQKEGIASIYGPEGRIRLSTEFHQDQQQGVSYEYFPNGNVLKEIHYIDNLKEGEEKTFYETGRLAQLISYEKGNKQGPSKEWDKAGNLLYETCYQHNQLHGICNRYHADGTPSLFQIYNNGKLIEKKQLTERLR